MSKKLEIGASLRSLRRRQYASEAQQEPGESAWDLPFAHDAGSPFEADTLLEREQPSTSNLNLNRNRTSSGPQPYSSDAPRETRSALAPDPDKDRQTPILSPAPGVDTAENSIGSGPSLDLMRFARSLWLRKWLVISITLISTVLFLMIALTMPHEWRATTTLISERSFEPLSHDLQTFVDTIKLPSSLDETMRRAGISVMRSTLASAISVSLDDESKLFSISVTWNDPEMAARIAKIVAEQFMETSAKIRFNQIKERYNDSTAELREARKVFQRINNALVAYTEANQISSLDNQISALVGLITETEANYSANTAKVEALRAAKRRIDEQLEAEPKRMVTSSHYRSRLKQRLSDAQREMQEARRQYTEQSSKVIRLQHRIETLEQLIAESGGEGASEKVYETNPKHDELFLRKQQTDDQLEIAEAEANAQRDTLDESRRRLSQLVAAGADWKALSTQSQDAAHRVDSLTARLSELQIAMRKVNSSFSILEEASPPDLPEPSLRKLVLAAGIILGIGTALFVALRS